tara:strand:+ start:423 stop:2033 length:1611 start_codon:yes stop_codon:yes gene_type:complete
MIDQEGIKSLEKGASDIRLTGNMGESSPAQETIKAGIPKDMTMDEAFEIFIQSEGRPPKNVPELLEFFKNRTLSRGPIIPSDEDPINPFQPKPIGPVLPDRQMAAFGGIMGLDQRRQYGLGSSFKRAFNKVTKPFVKVAQKLMPKELAGVAQIASPFLGPIYGPLAMAAGQAKQRGKISPVALAASLLPYTKFRGGEGIGQFKPTGYGGMGEGVSLRDIFLRGEIGGGAGSDPIFGEYGTKADEFLFGTPEIKGTEGAYEATSGIIGKGGEAFQLGSGNEVGLLDTKAGQLAFSSSKDPTKLNKLKIASWGTGIIAGIQAGKYKSEMEAAAAAEEAALAANEAATEADLQAARDWAIATFNDMSVYAEGGRINKNMGGIMGNRIGYNEGGFVITLMDGTKVQIPEGAYDNGTFKDIIYSSSKGDLLREEIIRKLSFADGGRINKNMGGEFNMPPAGLSSLQTKASDVTPQGMELDLRGGGFIPIGKAEKADDVPARVSKNEFVFTADAVKAAGGGSVNEGAKRMYDTMKRLESQVV